MTAYVILPDRSTRALLLEVLPFGVPQAIRIPVGSAPPYEQLEVRLLRIEGDLAWYA